MTDTISIGSYQGPVHEGDVRANLETVLRQLHAPENAGLHFLCFPETFLTGYSPEAIIGCALPAGGLEIKALIDATRDLDTVLLVGFAERSEKGIFNSQIILQKGHVLGIAHKTMLTQGYDDRYFTTDLSLPVFSAHGVKFGVAICHTTSFVEPALYLRWMGARLLFTPHFNKIPPYARSKSGERMTFWEHRQMVLNNQAALATLLKMVVVRSNVVIIQPDALGSGDSNIWGMNGELVAAGEPFTEMVVRASFDQGIFTHEHEINRQAVPIQLLEMIADAARQYGSG
jgi:predicted amidohydrolase